MFSCCFCKNNKKIEKPLLSLDEKCKNSATESEGWKTYGEFPQQEYKETVNIAEGLKKKYANLKRLIRDDE
jgi:hypothetical protein